MIYNEIDHAKQAIEDYHADIRAGGEPLYPKWAFDLLKQVKQSEKKEQKMIKKFLSGVFCGIVLFVPATLAILYKSF